MRRAWDPSSKNAISIHMMGSARSGKRLEFMAGWAEEAGGTRRVLIWAPVVAVALLVAAAIGLWARHGAAVFFDMVSAGLAYCF